MRKINMQSENYIFTFWEPELSMPDYIKLCMKTWEKNLSGYKIIVLNYSNLHEWIPKEIIKKILNKDLTLAKQSDCIRAWMLYLYGGFWLDADTIITSSEILKNACSHECTMIGYPEKKKVHIAFIYANKGSKIIKKWAETIPRHIKLYEYKTVFKFLFYPIYKYIKCWNFFGNAILDRLVKKALHNELYIIDAKNMNLLLEYSYNDEKPIESYVLFYFEKHSFEEILSKNKGVILLHNSWTPQKFKDMSEKEFLNSDVTLARILKKILENEKNVSK